MKWLIVHIFAVHSILQPVFMDEPQDTIEAKRGETVVINCLIDGNTKTNPNFVQWVKGSLALGFPPLSRSRYEQAVQLNDYSLKIENVQLEDEDNFECQITPYGLRSKVGRLEVITPPETVEVISLDGNVTITDGIFGKTVQVVEGVPAHFGCIATNSKPQTNVNWLINGNSIASHSIVSGETLKTTVSKLTFIPEHDHHNQLFVCHANNPALEQPVQKHVHLDVQTKPTVKIEIEHELIVEGASLRVNCSTVSNPSVHSYSWFIDDEPIYWNKSSIELESISYGFDQKVLRCVAANAIGTGHGQRKLDVLFHPRLPTMPASVIANQSKPFELQCPAQGNPEPVVSWTDAVGNVVSSDARLFFKSITYAHYGVYTCCAENDLGISVSYVKLQVHGTPYMTSKPTQNARFLSCDFVSNPPAKAVHIIDIANNNIVFEESRLTDNQTSITALLDAGSYECKVYNELGTSSMIILLEPESFAIAAIGIVIATTIIFVLLVFAVFLRLCWCKSRHQLALNSKDESGFECFTNDKHCEISFPFPVSTKNPKYNFLAESPHLSLVKPSDDKVRQSSVITRATNKHLQKCFSEKSAHDDGYGTGSETNRRTHTVSSESSNCGYDVKLSSTKNEPPKHNATESRVCIIWDDSTITFPDYKSNTNWSSARCVSRV